MKLEAIKMAVDNGREVFWANKGYKVVKDNIGQYLIKHQNGNYIGLTHADGKTLNGKEKEFFTESKYDRLVNEITWDNWIHNEGQLTKNHGKYQKSYIAALIG